MHSKRQEKGDARAVYLADLFRLALPSGKPANAIGVVDETSRSVVAFQLCDGNVTASALAKTLEGALGEAPGPATLIVDRSLISLAASLAEWAASRNVEIRTTGPSFRWSVAVLERFARKWQKNVAYVGAGLNGSMDAAVLAATRWSSPVPSRKAENESG